MRHGGRERAFETRGVVPSEMDIPREGVLTVGQTMDGTMGQPAAVRAADPGAHLRDRSLDGGRGNARPVALRGRAIPAFPILMWLASLLVAYITVNTLVLRHLSRLSARMEDYRSGGSLPDFKLGPEAPAELREMADSYNDLVTRRDQGTRRRWKTASGEQKLLLPRGASPGEEQPPAHRLHPEHADARRGGSRREKNARWGACMTGLMSLSSIHRALYTGSRLDRVRVDHLLAEIVAGLEDVALPR